MNQYIPLNDRRSALEQARAKLFERHYRATCELEDVKQKLNIVESQLIVMTGLADPAPVASDGDQ